MPTPGALIALDGTLNLRDLGGWPTASGGRTVHGRLYRSDRLSDLTPSDHRRLEQLGVVTVIDLRFEAEIRDHPSRLWSTVTAHHEIPMAGEVANQRSFVDRAVAGEFDGITDDDVGQSYIQMLETHGAALGAAVEAILAGGPALFHCTAGKDRTGLLSMLVLRTVGVGEADVLADFGLSNVYRAEKRISQLRPVFAAHGLDIDSFRPALSAPRLAMIQAMAWIDATHRSAAGYLSGPGGVDDAERRLVERLAPARS